MGEVYRARDTKLGRDAQSRSCRIRSRTIRSASTDSALLLRGASGFVEGGRAVSRQNDSTVDGRVIAVIPVASGGFDLHVGRFADSARPEPVEGRAKVETALNPGSRSLATTAGPWFEELKAARPVNPVADSVRSVRSVRWVVPRLA